VVHSLSATTPTLPANYTQKRRVGSILVNAGGTVAGYVQNGDEFLWVNATLDYNTGLGAASRTLIPLSVPTGVKVNALFYAGASNSGTACFAFITSPDQNDGNANQNISISVNVVGAYSFSQFSIRTDTSGRIGARSSVASNTTLIVGTQGWIDTRGRFA
jgi:hypothetical protein